MEARVTKAFPGVTEGEVYPRVFEVGEMLTGRMAEIALANGWAEPAGGEQPGKGKRRGGDT